MAKPPRLADAPTILVTGQMLSGVGRYMRLGMHACARAHGWTLVSEYGEWDLLEDWIREWRPLAVLATLCSPEVVLRSMARAPTVAAIANTQNVAVPAIDVDENAVARTAADQLLGLGLRQFAVFGNWDQHWAAARCAAFEQAIAAAGFPCRRCAGNELQEREAYWASASHALTSQWLQSLPRPVGIFSVCDRWGQILANHCRALGVRVPEDAAILGADNDESVCEMSEPPLSSVAIHWQQIGYDAAMMAGRLAHGKAVEPVLRLVKPTGVVVRQSSDLLAVQDEDVASALRVIRHHADRPLSIGELLRKVPVDRHRLERRFHEQVGRRMLQELRRVHVEQAKRLLVSTELPMPQIAERSGFANATKLGIAFKEETGTTPTAYRSRFRLRA